MSKCIAGKELIETMVTTMGKCVECKHYLKNNKCKAFPDWIPDEVFWGDYEEECNNGIKFEEG